MDETRSGVWTPIKEVPEEEGFTAIVRSGDVSMLGKYECGHTWGWVDSRGNHIYPTRYLKE